jgi:two-component system sensor histidine kinase CpxA
MSNLVNELLLFSKAGLNPAAVERGPVKVNSAIERAVRRETQTPDAVRVSAVPGLLAIGNEDYLVRAISNVLRNALRYAGSAGPIEVTAKQHGSNIEIGVADSGPGLPPESTEEVFEPFHRLESSRSRDSGGVGLGLAIVKTCIEACDGTVSCRNRMPSGLEVTIRIPAASS